MTRTAAIFIKCCFLVLLAALTPMNAQAQEKTKPSAKSVTLSPKDAAAARRTIVAWLECEECREGQLDKVVKLGSIAVPTLTAVLEHGASPTSRQLLRQRLAGTYRGSIAYQKTHPKAKVRMSEDKYVEFYLSNFNAMYKTRAAVALGAIGGNTARQSLLTAAKRKEEREDVRRTIRDSLSKIR